METVVDAPVAGRVREVVAGRTSRSARRPCSCSIELEPRRVAAPPPRRLHLERVQARRPPGRQAGCAAGPRRAPRPVPRLRRPAAGCARPGRAARRGIAPARSGAAGRTDPDIFVDVGALFRRQPDDEDDFGRHARRGVPVHLPAGPGRRGGRLPAAVRRSAAARAAALRGRQPRPLARARAGPVPHLPAQQREDSRSGRCSRSSSGASTTRPRRTRTGGLAGAPRPLIAATEPIPGASTTSPRRCATGPSTSPSWTRRGRGLTARPSGLGALADDRAAPHAPSTSRRSSSARSRSTALSWCAARGCPPRRDGDLLEVMTRRYYRIRALDTSAYESADGHAFALAELRHEGQPPRGQPRHADDRSLAGDRGIPSPTSTPASTCRLLPLAARGPDGDAVANALDDARDPGRSRPAECLRRLVSPSGGPGMGGVQHVTFRRGPDGVRGGPLVPRRSTP